jgi:hypothetical protein
MFPSLKPLNAHFWGFLVTCVRMTRWYDRLCDILLDNSKRVAFMGVININVKYTSILNLARGSVLAKRKRIDIVKTVNSESIYIDIC